jgi:hypothetical protein
MLPHVEKSPLEPVGGGWEPGGYYFFLEFSLFYVYPLLLYLIFFLPHI